MDTVEGIEDMDRRVHRGFGSESEEDCWAWQALKVLKGRRCQSSHYNRTVYSQRNLEL